MNKRKRLVAYGLQITGAVSLSVAAFLWFVIAGFVVLGVLAMVFGIALEHEVGPAEPASGPVVAAGGDA